MMGSLETRHEGMSRDTARWEVWRHGMMGCLETWHDGSLETRHDGMSRESRHGMMGSLETRHDGMSRDMA